MEEDVEDVEDVEDGESDYSPESPRPIEEEKEPISTILPHRKAFIEWMNNTFYKQQIDIHQSELIFPDSGVGLELSGLALFGSPQSRGAAPGGRSYQFGSPSHKRQAPYQRDFLRLKAKTQPPLLKEWMLGLRQRLLRQVHLA